MASLPGLPSAVTAPPGQIEKNEPNFCQKSTSEKRADYRKPLDLGQEKVRDDRYHTPERWRETTFGRRVSLADDSG